MSEQEPTADAIVETAQESESSMLTLSQTSVTKAVVANATTTAKRQRSLVDMFPKSTTKPLVKKPRLSEGDISAPSESSTRSSTSPFKSSPVVIGKTPLNSIPFNIASFKESLTAEQRELLMLECDTIQLSWLKLLTDEIKKPYFMELKRFLKKEGVIGADQRSIGVFPSAKDIYAWSKSPLGRVRAVIIGQDPYHNVGQAHGLCFSVPKGVPTPPSLKNIFAEIKAEYPEFVPPSHGNLVQWAHNGVLLLNTCLTVKAHQANSHAGKGWEKFTEKVIEIVSIYGGANLNKTGVGKGIVFLAWGAPAAKRVASLDKKKHLILTSPHPSPLSAHRGFLGNGHFKKANDWLESKYGTEAKIDWCRLDAGSPSIS